PNHASVRSMRSLTNAEANSSTKNGTMMSHPRMGTRSNWVIRWANATRNIQSAMTSTAGVKYLPSTVGISITPSGINTSSHKASAGSALRGRRHAPRTALASIVGRDVTNAPNVANASVLIRSKMVGADHTEAAVVGFSALASLDDIA